MIPVKRDPLTMESFVINVDGQEVVLTLANKPQLGQDTDMEQNSRDSNTSSTDKGLDFGQQPNANLGSWVRITQWKEKHLILSEGFSRAIGNQFIIFVKVSSSYTLKHAF